MKKTLNEIRLDNALNELDLAKSSQKDYDELICKLEARIKALRQLIKQEKETTP
jgi:hypothetical protein